MVPYSHTGGKHGTDLLHQHAGRDRAGRTVTGSMLDLADVYRREGLRVHELPGWQTRGHSAGPISPRGGGWHHTADNSGLISVFNLNGPDIRPDVPQPRANVWVPRQADFDLVLVCAGLANHFGKGSRTALALASNGQVSLDTPDAVDAQYPDDLDDTAPGNATMIGHEVENLGDGQPLTEQQLRALPRIAAAECRLFGWSVGHHMHHRQYTRRKPDMQWRGDLWSLTEAVLRGQEEDGMASAEFEKLEKKLDDMFRLIVFGDAPNPTGDNIGTHPNNLEAVITRLRDVERQLDEVLARLPQ